MCAASFPAMVAAAECKALKPIIGAMVLLQDVIEVFELPNLDGAAVAGKFQDPVHGLQAGEIGAAFVDDDPVWHTVCADRLPEEPPGCSQISATALVAKPLVGQFGRYLQVRNRDSE